MEKVLLFVAIGVFVLGAHAQKGLTSRQIYESNRGAIVQIGIGNKFSGNGFIVSSDGLVLTANHVVATPESQRKTYATNLNVVVNGKVYPAQPMETVISDDMANFDFAFLKIDASNLPHLTLGTWDEVEIGDKVTMFPSWPGIGCILLEGTVSNRMTQQTFLGPKPLKSIIFQAPIRKGFSGSPIFSRQGHVVGIVDTLVFGISPALAQLGTKWSPGPGKGDFVMGGASLGGSLTEIINNLDQNLISGLGSGVAIDYAKKQQKAAPARP
ncbi:MAG: serine protease [Candidatus Sulfotelmatobacter sp.]